MSGPTARQRQFGDGPLSRITALVYTLVVVEMLLALVLLPSLVLLTLLRRDASNVPLVGLAAVPAGPALAAALTALHRHRDVTDLHPAAAFWHGLRTGTLPVLRLWLPAVLLLTVLGVNLTHLDAAGLPQAWAVPIVAVGVTALVWAVLTVVINALFTFRARDVARLARYFMLRTPGAALGVAALLVVCAAVVVAATEAAAVLASSVLSMLLLQTCRPMIALIEQEFVARPVQ